MARVMFHNECFTSSLRAIPIIKRMMADGGHQVLPFSTEMGAGGKATSLPMVQRLFTANGLTQLNPSSLGLERHRAAIREAQARYRAGFERRLKAMPAGCQPTYRGVPVLQYSAGAFLNANFARVGLMALFEKVLDQLQPDVVINGYDFGTVKRPCVTVTRDRGIPTIGLQDGAWTFLRSRRVSDYFCLWGEHFRDMHLEAGYAPERLAVTGAPSLDPPLDPGFNQEAVMRSLGLDPERRTVLVGVTVRDVRRELSAILKALEGMDDVQVAVKLHPEFIEEQRAGYQTVIDASSTAGVILQHEVLDPMSVVRVSDVMVSHHSNLFFEALALGLDLVLLCSAETHQSDGSGKTDPIQYEADTYSLPAWSPGEAADAVVRALQSPGRLAHSPQAKRWRERIYYKVDGNSSRRHVDFIEQVLERHATARSALGAG